LTALERASNRTGATAWPPTLAFDAFEAGAKKVLGSFLRDEELVREGRLLQAKVSELGESERLKAAADQKRQAADAQLEQRQQSAEEVRERARREAEQAEQRIQREKAQEERAVSEDAARRRQEAAKLAEARDKVVTAQEREAERTRIAEESAVLGERRQALTATKKAQELDDALEVKKAERKAP
jgi:Fe2+ transport system protein B